MTPPRTPRRGLGRALVAGAFALAAAAALAEGPARAPAPDPRPGGTAADPAEAVAVATTARAIAFPLGEAPRLRLGGALAVEGDHPLWGGLSGLAVSPDGARFWAVSDRGALFTGRLRREGDRLAGLDDVAAIPLRDPRGRPVGSGGADAEGLARGADGALFLSLEGDRPAVWRLARPGARAAALPAAPEFARLQLNSGLEALAIDAGGALYAIPERSGAMTRPFPVFRLPAGGDAWAVGALPRSGEFLVTGADVGPDGRLYVAERAFTWLGGFSARLRAAPLDGFPALAPETLLERRGGSDNIESVAVWRGPDGRLRLLLLADDNFNAFQRTVFAELILD